MEDKKKRDEEEQRIVRAKIEAAELKARQDAQAKRDKEERDM